MFAPNCTLILLQNTLFDQSTAHETLSTTSPVPGSCFASRHLACDFMHKAFARRRHKVKREKSSAKRLVKAVHLLAARRRVILHAFVYQPPLSFSSPCIKSALDIAGTSIICSLGYRDDGGMLFNPFTHSLFQKPYSFFFYICYLTLHANMNFDFT